MTGAKWHKSTYSGGANTDCVEVAENLPGVVLVRDTKDQGAGPVLQLAPDAWSGFLSDVKAGRYNL